MNCGIENDTEFWLANPLPFANASFESIEDITTCQSANGHAKKVKNNKVNWHSLKPILPKTALEVLKELKNVSIENYTSIGSQKDGYKVNITMNSKEYEAKGRTKKDTENLVYELALRDLVASKLNDQEVKYHIISFALHKLYSQWELDGYLVSTKEFSNDLPADWQTMSPVSLLKLMREETRFVEYELCGQPCVSIFVDNQEFTSCGRTQTRARYNAAVIACNALFQTNFTIYMEDETIRASDDDELPVNTKLPTDWQTINPLILLNIMRPEVKFEHTISKNAADKEIYHTSVSVDKQNFTACAECRAKALETVSAIVCNTLFNTNFVFHSDQKVLAGSEMHEKNSAGGQPALRRKLPTNWRRVHPNNLLQKICPKHKLIHHSSLDEISKIVHHMSTSIDGKTFTASAKTKKLATHKLTIEVCNEMFKTNYKLGF